MNIARKSFKPYIACRAAYRYLSNQIDTYRNYRRQIRYYNWANIGDYFEQFISNRRIPIPNKTKVNFTSVLGRYEECRNNRSGINIFSTGENLCRPEFSHYHQYIQQHPFDLEIGFDYTEKNNRIRFPFWMLRHFKPTASYNDIHETVQRLTHPSGNTGERFCSLVASHDEPGVRRRIYELLNNIQDVDSAGSFLHNTDLLNNQYHQDKHSYLQTYKFNICPENSDREGYVTEKIFDAILAGCIPIYWGSNNSPEPELINSNAVLFYHKETDNAILQSEILKLINDKEYFSHFTTQPRLSPEATDIIWQYFSKLEKHLRNILK